MDWNVEKDGFCDTLKTTDQEYIKSILAIGEDGMKGTNMTEGSILKCCILFSLPLLGGSLFQQLYSTVDLLFVGNYLGELSAAAVGASGILVTCLVGLFTGISVGAGVVVSQYWGAGKEELVKNIIVTVLLAGLLGGFLMTLFSTYCSKTALLLLNVPQIIMAEALTYLRIYCISIVPMILYNVCAGILRATGDAGTPFAVLAAGGVLNVCMNLLLLVVLQYGIAGAAAATVISQSFTAVALLCCILRRYTDLSQKLFSWQLLYRVFKIGLPIGLQTMVITLSNMIVQYFINGLGETSIAAFSIYFKVESLIYLPILAFGQAMVTFAGQNIGAGTWERVQRAVVICNVFVMIVILLLSAICLRYGEVLFGLFGAEEAVIREGMQIIRMTFPFYFIYGIMEITGSVIRGAEKSMQSMAIVLTTLCLMRICLLFVLAEVHANISVIAAVYPLTWTVAALLFVGYYRKYCNMRYKTI